MKSDLELMEELAQGMKAQVLAYRAGPNDHIYDAAADKIEQLVGALERVAELAWRYEDLL